MRPSDLICACAALLFSGAAALAEVPTRVVSMNLCTDQLAMLLTDRDQLISVSALASDPMASAMADLAADWPSHTSGAEEVFAMTPDLVIAGEYTARASVQMLKRLGVRVETFGPARSLEDVATNLRKMGALLGREEQADVLAVQFEADLEALRSRLDTAPRVALYYANGYSLGVQTLAGQILIAAGVRNVATELGMNWGGNLPLERLVMAAPELVVTGEKYAGASRSEELLDHPALAAFATHATTGSDWLCGTPFVLRAIDDLQEAAR